MNKRFLRGDTKKKDILYYIHLINIHIIHQTIVKRKYIYVSKLHVQKKDDVSSSIPSSNLLKTRYY